MHMALTGFWQRRDREVPGNRSRIVTISDHNTEMSAADQHAPFSDNVANRRYDQNLSRRHGLTGELVLPDERRGQPLGPSLVSVVIRAFTKRVIHPA